jgi:DNA-binding protein H-NS
MNLNVFAVTVGGAKSLVFGTTSAEEACDAVLRAQYPTEVAQATESDLAPLSHVELLSLYSAGTVQIKNIGKARKSGVAKYRHPENDDLTWTGRGRAPAWFQALIDAGHSEESLLIAEVSEPAEEVAEQTEF